MGMLLHVDLRLLDANLLPFTSPCCSHGENKQMKWWGRRGVDLERIGERKTWGLEKSSSSRRRRAATVRCSCRMKARRAAADGEDMVWGRAADLWREGRRRGLLPATRLLVAAVGANRRRGRGCAGIGGFAWRRLGFHRGMSFIYDMVKNKSTDKIWWEAHLMDGKFGFTWWPVGVAPYIHLDA
jgi:hypothetical protein